MKGEKRRRVMAELIPMLSFSFFFVHLCMHYVVSLSLVVFRANDVQTATAHSSTSDASQDGYVDQI